VSASTGGGPPSAGAPAPLDPHERFARDLEGKKIGDRYVVSRILGRGGMGVVAAARYVELDQEVAIKFMFPENAANATLSARFTREAKLAAKLQSPHLVRVTDVGRTDGGVPYLVMEMLAGHDLGEELETRGPLPVDEAVTLVLQAIAGLAELHALGVVHRDLKPSNLFLTEAAGARTVKVLDFGISKDVAAASSSLTATEHLLGTPNYMAPEQIKLSKEVDARADVWSLGVILYELLTGALPFEPEGDAVGELFGLILFTDPIPPRKRRADFPAALEAVVLRCIRRERAERFATVADLADALRPFAEPASQPRIDAIRRVIERTPPPRLERPAAGGATPELAADRSPTPAKATVPQATPRVELGAEVVLPRAKAGEIANDQLLGATSAVESSRAAHPIAPARSLATSSRSAPYERDGWRTKSRSAGQIAIGLVAVLAVAGAIVAVVRATSSGTAPPDPSEPPSAAAAPSVAEPTAPPSHRIAPAPPPATQVAVPALAPSATASAAALPAVAGGGPRAPIRHLPAGATKTPASSGAPPTPAAASTSTAPPRPPGTTSTEDLILDRK
jgi:serine/threonine-protein kinase